MIGDRQLGSSLSFLPKACFTAAFVATNNLGAEGFAAWVFHPDMLFGAKRNWWGSRRQRPKPHEGIDLCLFRDGHDRIISVDESIRIPAMYDGTVVKILADFLGESIILEHRFPDSRQGIFLTIYGHIISAEGLAKGRSVKQGQVIASVAPPKSPKSPAPPHLHLTVAWSQRTVLFETIDWSTINDPERLQLLDPLQIIDGAHVLLESIP